ncbi:zinc uptake protein ZrgA [Vibrio japonicus]|uniref:DUF2796 domain-containing protein n=1 Tax=Vibrio japonicus TaxID=1824638 RepID=A0ABY5LJ72_9VIBR|nr:DUF2796 domain-containing protein [Vibrio japonicus]UUM30878.1 DUF2796 domain-containing protein [Vibrio japonicus]
MNKYSPLAALIALTLSHSVAAEENFRQHDAHVHGEVELNIAQDGAEILFEITAPGADVVGFEHAPTTDEQRHTLKQAEVHLSDASAIFTLAEEAGCSVKHQVVSHTLGEDDDHDHDHDHEDHSDEHHDHKHEEHENHHDHKEGHDEHHEHSDHGEFTVEYHYQCENITQLKTISTSWFERFPTTEAIKMNLLTETKQASSRLDKNNNIISL